MKWLSLLILPAALLGAAADPFHSQEDIDSGKVLQALSKNAYDNAMARLEKSRVGCTIQNVRVRKEWRKIPGEERQAFVKAIECLMQQKSLYPDVEGAKYYVYSYEDSLRRKCGYTGTFPYWEWGLDAHNMSASPVFDGSPTSLGGNGVFIPGHQPAVPNTPAGSGGGCVPNGHFSNYTVNLGPSREPGEPLRHNPRCLKRDLNTHICARWASLRNTTDTILQSPTIEAFQAMVQGDDRYPPAASLGMAVHGGGHYAISGDPGGDFYWSPLEPGFYLHHGQIDRMYFVWQNLDWENRQGIFGTGTMKNVPPSPDMTLDDVLDISPINLPRQLRELIDTLGGDPFCFVYE
ncbi:tyrosinase central domain-containing protein [Colletotrichum truncatum]|uniref:Tyrosinase central domain-containing protein n=1 Tax=Colletotrichum truncatum TaxID=5467 RepID=A0ACC3YVP2_COLTU|nr:tyrosinase central domain-containing protein [Colletotrichum truncatum]KAF6791312.1 tyrosinase central domain-containing protein [Colletotrichum truncatum]